MGPHDYLLPGDEPAYKRIAAAVQLGIAEQRLRPGERLPTVRELAWALGLNPNTVARAYSLLEQECIVCARQGRGTFVAPNPSPREPTLRFRGSHDPALDILWSLLAAPPRSVRVEVATVGSLWGLVALERGEADLAGTHLLDAETGEYNLPWLRRVLPGRKLVVVRLACRQQGLIYREDMRDTIRSMHDLVAPNVRFVNRQRGSGTRLLLDQQLRRTGISPRNVRGYEHEVMTHDEVATAVASGRADAGLGVYSVARAHGLGFRPLVTEQYDLVALADYLPSEVLDVITSVLRSEDFHRALASMGGYTTEDSGQVGMIETLV